MSHDHRPEQCRFRLIAEGKPYPRSGCGHCKQSSVSGGYPARCQRPPEVDTADVVTVVSDVVELKDEPDQLNVSVPSSLWFSLASLAAYSLEGNAFQRDWGSIKFGDKVFWQTDYARDKLSFDDEIRFVRADDREALTQALADLDRA